MGHEDTFRKRKGQKRQNGSSNLVTGSESESTQRNDWREFHPHSRTGWSIHSNISLSSAPSMGESATEREGDQPSSLSSELTIEEDEEESGVPSDSLLFFDKERHVTYLEMMYQLLPYQYQSQEINRLTLAYFAISGLHLLGALDRVCTFYW